MGDLSVDHLHAPGAKEQEGKPRAALVLGDFANALLEVSKVGTFGAYKYSEHGWTVTPDGVNKYDDAMLRHWLYEHAGHTHDSQTHLLHAAHTAWNALARLEFLIQEQNALPKK